MRQAETDGELDSICICRRQVQVRDRFFASTAGRSVDTRTRTRTRREDADHCTCRHRTAHSHAHPRVVFSHGRFLCWRTHHHLLLKLSHQAAASGRSRKSKSHLTSTGSDAVGRPIRFPPANVPTKSPLRVAERMSCTVFPDVPSSNWIPTSTSNFKLNNYDANAMQGVRIQTKTPVYGYSVP